MRRNHQNIPFYGNQNDGPLIINYYQHQIKSWKFKELLKF